MEIKSHFKLFVGILFTFFGVLGVFDLWSFFEVSLPWQVWPIGLIVVGVLFMIRQKGLAFVCVGLLLFLSIFSSGWECCGGTSRDFTREFDLRGVDYVDLSVNYGVGNIVLSKSDYDKIIFEGATGDLNGPKIDEEVFEDGEKKVIEVSRGEDIRMGEKEEWRFFLGDDVFYNLDFEYGMSDVSLDLRDLKVDSLSISQGVSDTRVVFGEYPSVVEIDGGVSDITLEFANGSGVVVEVKGGLLDADFDDGFAEKDGKWYSEGYDEDGENIEVSFDGGVSDLKVSFYED
ncbi:hypothetical protein J4226_01545 [Candidatus Pacearchaeota archaeon]|nr:hypothetical protein [Candidatus Pacearchaeota archaeon]